MINVILIICIAAVCVAGIRSVIKRLSGDCGCGGSSAGTITGGLFYGTSVWKQRHRKGTDASRYTEQAELCIEGMKCGRCAQAVAESLGSVEGVYVKKVHPGKKTAYVLMESSVTDSMILQAVSSAGYHLTQIRRSPLDT